MNPHFFVNNFSNPRPLFICSCSNTSTIAVYSSFTDLGEGRHAGIIFSFFFLRRRAFRRVFLFFVFLLTRFAYFTTTATTCCTHDEKDRNDVEKEVRGISCSPSPLPLPSLSTVLSFLLGRVKGIWTL